MFLACFQTAVAETITATDGRKFELNSDGTYRAVVDGESAIINIEESKPYFLPYAGEYNQNSVRLMAVFKNLTGKR